MRHVKDTTVPTTPSRLRNCLKLGRSISAPVSQRRRFAREQMDAWVKERGVILIGVDLDESPMVYRRLPEVLAETFQHNQNPA